MPPQPVTPMHLVVDTGVDDALALVAAALHRSLRLTQVTVSAGNVDLPSAWANTRHVLAALGPAGDVPVTRGAATRLDGQPFSTRLVHGPDGLAGQRLRSNRPGSGVDDLSGAPLVASVTGTLVCAAPLTTLTWLPAGPVLATYSAPGEANEALDPEAARQVMASWTVTHATAADALTPRAVEDAWAGVPAVARDSPLGRLVGALLRHQAARGAGLGDAAAVLCLGGGPDPLGDLVALLRR
jgi:pyrimidine-specific ribonucleoside hydrolase